jgi:hypothetical protein
MNGANARPTERPVLMKSVSITWVLAGTFALGLGMVAEACATSNDATGGSDSGVDATFGTGTGTGVSAETGLGTGTGIGLGTGTGVGTGTGAGPGTDSGADSGTDGATGSDSGADAGTDSGSDAGTGTGSGTGSGSGTGTGSGTGVGGSIPTTCAKANNAIGCCGPNGKLYYCTGSGTGGTPTAKTCSSGEVCGWDTAKGYFYCVTTPGTPPDGGSIACE